MSDRFDKVWDTIMTFVLAPFLVLVMVFASYLIVAVLAQAWFGVNLGIKFR